MSYYKMTVYSTLRTIMDQQSTNGRINLSIDREEWVNVSLNVYAHIAIEASALVIDEMESVLYD